MAGHQHVYGIDEQPSENEPDYLPYDKLTKAAATFNQQVHMQSASATTRALVEKMSSLEKGSIRDALLWLNKPEVIDLQHRPYMQYLPVGDTELQAGAELNAMWYLRNAKIFGKMLAASKPGDRVLVIYGSGHNYWLRHFIQESPNLEWIEANRYL